MTVGELSREATQTLRASGSESARLDAQLLLGHVLHVDRASLLAAPEAPVGADHVAQFRALVGRRAMGEPVAYIRGIKEFYGLAFSVDTRALIPRPETELLVELGLEHLSQLLVTTARPADASPVMIWDIGTGSGAVAIALAVESRRRGYGPDVRFRASDISSEAVALATENAVAHGVADLIDFAVADLADPPAAAPIDILLANVPYIPSATVPTLPVATSFEPPLALDGGADGLDLVRRLMDQLAGVLTADGVALLEIGTENANGALVEAAARLPGWSATIHPDLAEFPFVLELHRATSA